MNKAFTILITATLMLSMNMQAQETADRGTKMTSDNYTGDVYIKLLDNDEKYSTNKIELPPGAHNDWHIHPDATQTMFVLSGRGLYQEEGKPVQLLETGDMVTTPANVKHWNGATATESCKVLTMSEINPASHIEWMGKVPDLSTLATPSSLRYEDMIVRISEIEVYPEYLEEYLKFALTVGETSTREEPGVIAIFPMTQQRNAC